MSKSYNTILHLLPVFAYRKKYNTWFIWKSTYGVEFKEILYFVDEYV